MPQVPLYGDNRVQETDLKRTPLSTETPSIGAFGGGERLAQGAGMVEKIILDAKKEADELAVQDFDNNLSLVGKELNEKIVSKKGQDAFNLPDEIGSEYDKKLADLEKKLHGSTQRGIAKQRAFERKQQIVSAAYRHSSAEMGAYDNSTKETGIRLSREEAILNGHDPAFVENSIKKQQELLDGLAKNNAEVQGKLPLLKLDAASKTHLGVLSSILTQGDDIKAEEYFEKNKDKLLPTDREKMQEVIADTSRVNKSFRDADTIFQSSGGSLQRAYKMTDKYTDAKTRKMVEQRVEYLFDRQKAKQEDIKRNRSAKFANLIEKNNGDVSVVKQDPEWQQMSVDERENYISYAKGFNSADVDDLEYKDELLNLAADKGSWFSGGSGQKEFLSEDLHDPANYTRLTPKTREQMLKLQTDLRAKKGDVQEYLSTLNTFRGQTTRIMRDAGIVDRKAQLRIENDLESVFDQRSKEMQKPLNSDDKLKITKEYLTKVKVNEVTAGGDTWTMGNTGLQITAPERSFGISKSLGTLKPSDINLNAITVDNIPPHLTPSILKFYKKQGIANPTNDQILNAYKMYLERQAARNLSEDVNQRVR